MAEPSRTGLFALSDDLVYDRGVTNSALAGRARTWCTHPSNRKLLFNAYGIDSDAQNLLIHYERGKHDQIVDLFVERIKQILHPNN